MDAELIYCRPISPFNSDPKKSDKILHLKASDPNSYHYKALECQEENKERSPLSQLVHRLSSNSTGHQFTSTIGHQQPKPKANFNAIWP